MSLDWSEAEAYLCKADPVLKKVVERTGACELSAQEGGFVTVADSIIGQQLSNKVARVLRARFRTLFSDGVPEAQQTLVLDDEALRRCGFSRAKMRYVRALAEAVVSGKLDFESVHQANDEAVVQTLTELPGIGRWTAEMYLIFALNRPDVLPLGDAAVVAALRSLYPLPEKQWEPQALEIAEPWRPWRSVASWYLWRHHSS
ncbi:MAG: DNA-3-methyladenine glycosylase 2 family protein [SAR324 cluster bacterium]|nr:DNA-3-methyladenine glycosylase 2 family protein [SAR324 cluster bacterium]